MTTSFRNRVLKFWEAFQEEEATIRQMIDTDVEGKILLNYTESVLKIAFTEIQFQMGITIDNKYELTLTPQGDRVRLIQYNYWLHYCPEDLKEKWVFNAAKPALVDTKYKIEMFGILIDENDILLYPTINQQTSKIELTVYSPKLNDLSSSHKYSIFFVFLDQYIGELYSIEHIKNIQFTTTKLKEDAIKMSALKKYIDIAIEENGWINSTNPLDGYFGYKVQPTEKLEWVLREDIAAGYSSCTSPISAYHYGDNTFYEKYKKDGLFFGFLFFENVDIADDIVVQFRANIEDQIIAQTAKHGIADCIGGATGFHFSYIDFIIYDYEAFIKIVKEVMSKYSFEEVGFSFFKAGSTPIMLSEVEL